MNNLNFKMTDKELSFIVKLLKGLLFLLVRLQNKKSTNKSIDLEDDEEKITNRAKAQ